MRILLDKSPRHIAEYTERYGHDFGQLRTPLTRNKIADTDWALDNGCFSGGLSPAWTRMVEEAQKHAAMWVALPDIVGSARRTLELFAYFERETAGVKRALVLQDGIGDVTIPWRKIDAVFIGGSDAFKIAPEAIQAAKCAKMIGKSVHVGRVNEPKRVRNWIDLADTIDGSGISMYDHMLEAVLATINGTHPQQQLAVA